MASKRNRKRLVLASVVIAGLTGGVMAAHATTFMQATAGNPSQDLSAGATAPAWPAVGQTCPGDCGITLDAGVGSMTVPDVVNGPQTFPFYGFNVNGDAAGAVTLAGGATSTIKVPVGTTLTITLTQAAGIADPIDLSFPSLKASDVTHVGNVYTVHASAVGTSVFQPGSNPDAPRQVAMGLVGTLIVTPAGCSSCAFDAAVPYADEAIVATTDLDAEFALNPAAFDMSYFGQPRTADDTPRKVYHLIDGKSFPDTDVIDVHSGDSVLLHYVNAGVTDKSMGLLGLRQTLLGRNASKYTDPQTFIAPLIGPGETADVAVSIPGGAAAGQRYSLMDQGRQMNHGTGTGFGGALTFLNVWAGTPPVTTIPATTVPDTTIPDTTIPATTVAVTTVAPDTTAAATTVAPDTTAAATVAPDTTAAPTTLPADTTTTT